MNDVAAFFDRQADRFGPSGVLPHHEARAERLVKYAGAGPHRVLELGCGSGGTAVACAKRGHIVTAIELSPKRAAFARELAAKEGESRVTVHEDDFYVADLGGSYDVVTYWNGFGVGMDGDQRRLLRRVSEEWLMPGGTILVDVFNPTWWAVQSTETKRHDEYDAWQRTRYDAAQARFVDRWWSQPDERDVLEQSVRCYAPPDLFLLLEGTGLRVGHLIVDDHEATFGLNEAYSYLAVLRKPLPSES